MSYREGSYKRPAWIGIVVAAALVWWFFGSGISDAGRRARMSRPAGFEAEMMKDPDSGELYKTLKGTNPEEWRGFVEAGAGKMAQGASTAEMRDDTRRFMISILRNQAQRIAVAPHDDLVAAVTAQSHLFEKVRASDVMACAKMAATGSAPGASPALQPAITAAALVRLRAAAAGRDHPQANTAKATAEDVRALVTRMRENGLSGSDTTLFTTSGIAAASPQSQCEITYQSYHAALALPPDQGDRVMRWLIGP